jgi:O-antigen/teichoic acid export membrane protein
MSNKFGGAATIRAALLVTASTYISYAVGLVVSIVAARQLGPRDYGQYAYLVWLSGALTTLFCNGLTLSAIRFISECVGRNDLADARRVHHLLRSWYAATLVGVSLLFAIAYPWLLPAGWEKPGWLFAVAALIAAAGKAQYTFGTSISKGYGYFEIDAHTVNLMSLVSFVGVLIIAWIGAPVEAYIAFFVVLSLGHTLVTQILMRRAGIVASRSTINDDLRNRIREQYLWTALLFLVFAFSNKSVENVFLNSYVGPEAVGWFAIAAAMTRGGVDLLSSGLNSVLLPMMSHAFGSNDIDRANRILTDAMRYFLFLGVTLAGVGFLWAKPAIMMLYGKEYSPAIIGLQVMMVVGALAMPESATASFLLTTDRQRLRAALAFTALLLTLAAAAVLVPQYGLEGAIGAHAFSRATIFIAGIAIVARSTKAALPYAEFMRTLAAAGVGIVLAGCVLLVSSNLLAQIVAGLAYGIGCIGGSVLLSVWTKSDVRNFSSFADRQPWLGNVYRWIERLARGA